ncbi:unnamed protein product [Urochloa humidicola]
MFRALEAILRVRDKAVLLRPASSAFVNAFSSTCSSQRLAGKVAVITGGASGIGRATAAEFVRNGARVIIADVQDDLGRAAAAELGPDAAFYTRCDVADESHVAAAVDLAVARHGKLDIMFNNAGIGGDMSSTSIASMDMADFDRVMAINTRGIVAGVKHAARVMVPRRAGSIICTASTSAVVGDVATPAYGVSKAAVVGLVRAVAAELARSGVRVNAISPHAIPTPLAIDTMATWFPGRSAEEYRRIVEDMNEMARYSAALATSSASSTSPAISFMFLSTTRLRSSALIPGYHSAMAPITSGVGM